jgi:predicted lipoprotein with Yx(FWY)xxD motif
VRRRLLGLAVVATLATLTSVGSASGAPVAKNLVVTPAIRRSLFVALAAFHQLPTKDYVKLAPGMTYYAFDVTSKTYYAASGVVPSPNSLQAQVEAQDDGGYQLLTRAQDAKKWTIYDDGLGGAEGAKCPITIPSAVLAVWGWTQKCAPPAL